MLLYHLDELEEFLMIDTIRKSMRHKTFCMISVVLIWRLELLMRAILVLQ